MTTSQEKPQVTKTDEQWRAQLAPEEYAVLRQAGTERPWTGEYVDTKTVGVYECRACGAELFRSETKFDSHCGWPSFYEASAADNVVLREDRSHIPAFLADEEPRRYVCVYPFVRSYEWYLLPDQERREMLAEHGRLAREYPDVRANTVASFALGDYEWMLAFEADELHRIVDLMRELRAATARRHVREEVPFYTGVRKPIAELVNDLA